MIFWFFLGLNICSREGSEYDVKEGSVRKLFCKSFNSAAWFPSALGWPAPDEAAPFASVTERGSWESTASDL